MFAKPYRIIIPLILLVLTSDGFTRELVKIFEARHGEPVSEIYLPPGSEEKIWDSTPNRAFIGYNGQIYLPAFDRIRIFREDGIYISDRVLDADIDVNCLLTKKLVGVDKKDNVWYYFAYFETSEPFNNDYRHSLVAIDREGKIAQEKMLTIPFSQKHPYFRFQVLNNEKIFIQNKDGGYLVDVESNTAEKSECKFYDSFGNGYLGSYKWNDAYQANQNYLKRFPVDKQKSGMRTAGIEANSMDDLMAMKASEGVTYFRSLSGTNQSGYIAYSLSRTPPGDLITLPYFEYVIYDGTSDRIIEHCKIDWDMPPAQAPVVLFSLLDNDNSMLVGVEVPDVPWEIVSDGTGITGTMILPGPNGLVFRIYRIR